MDADGKQAALARSAKQISQKAIADDMDKVAAQIIALESDAVRSCENAVKHATETVRARAEVGRLLTEMKAQLGHGNWLAWLTRHLSGLSSSNDPAAIHRLAQKRMELYARIREGIIRIDDAKSVREAYLLADLLPESSRSDASGKALPGCDDPLLVRITRLTGALSSEIQRQPVSEWEPERKQIWRERLEPLATLYEQIR